MINHEQIENVKNSLCTIQTSFGKASGLFIMPHLVLTCWHALEKNRSQDIIFTNQLGKSSRMLKTKDGGKHHHDKALDLAVVELRDFIGPNGYRHLTTNENYTPQTQGFACTNFNGAVKHERIELDCTRTMIREDPWAFFNTHFQMGPGYSGSPVVDEQGRVMSVVSAGYVFYDYEEEIEAKKGTILEEQTDFCGPKPKKFAEFIANVLTVG